MGGNVAINKLPKRTVREQFVQHIEDIPELHVDSTLITRAENAWYKKMIKQGFLEWGLS